MTRYRIPYHMFLKWFVPYSRRGNFMMACLFVPAIGIFALLCAPSSWVYWAVVFLQVVWGTVTLNYHRREGLARGVLVQIIGVGILTAALFLI